MGEKYIIDDNIIENFTPKNEQFYLTNSFDLKNMFESNIIHIPCIIEDQYYINHLSSYENVYRFKSVLSKIKAQLSALKEAKIPSSNFDKFISKNLILEYYNECCNALKFIYNTKAVPEDYPHLVNAYLCAEYMSMNILKYKDKNVQVDYNPFTPFGRYGLNHNSFNILSLEKELRKNLKPESDEFIFCEYDYNAFEIRTSLALCKIKQPPGDLYEVLHKNDKENLSRQDFKKKLIVSIYSQREKETILYSILKNKHFYDMYPIINGSVTNIFGKKMSTDRYHLLSRILQSSAAYILYKNMFNLIRFMQEIKCKSKLSFCVHDSICLSIHKSEIYLIKSFLEILSKIQISELSYNDTFPMKVKTGENYGNLKQFET